MDIYMILYVCCQIFWKYLAQDVSFLSGWRLLKQQTSCSSFLTLSHKPRQGQPRQKSVEVGPQPTDYHAFQLSSGYPPTRYCFLMCFFCLSSLKDSWHLQSMKRLKINQIAVFFVNVASQLNSLLFQQSRNPNKKPSNLQLLQTPLPPHRYVLISSEKRSTNLKQIGRTMNQSSICSVWGRGKWIILCFGSSRMISWWFGFGRVSKPPLPDPIQATWNCVLVWGRRNSNYSCKLVSIGPNIPIRYSKHIPSIVGGSNRCKTIPIDQVCSWKRPKRLRSNVIPSMQWNRMENVLVSILC